MHPEGASRVPPRVSPSLCHVLPPLHRGCMRHPSLVWLFSKLPALPALLFTPLTEAVVSLSLRLFRLFPGGAGDGDGDRERR